MPQLSAVIEAYLISTGDGLSANAIQQYLKEQSANPEFRQTSEEQIHLCIHELNEYYEATGRSFTIIDTAKGWKFFTRAEFSDYLTPLHPRPKSTRLSQATLETLAIIAYRQPTTKASIESIRGVSSDSLVQKLLDAGLVKISGRAEVPGRPLLYSTTDFFYDHFGIKSINELPNAEDLQNLAWPTTFQQDESNDQLALGDYQQSTERE